MIFKEAYELLKNGKKVKLPDWKGYWVVEDNTIKMHTKDGRILSITETEDVFYTLNFIVNRDDWEVVDDKTDHLPLCKIYRYQLANPHFLSLLRQ